MSSVGAYEAKTHLPRLLDEVEAGGSVTITRNGRPVAVLAPVPNDAGTRAAARIIELRGEIKKGKASMRELIEEGRR